MGLLGVVVVVVVAGGPSTGAVATVGPALGVDPAFAAAAAEEPPLPPPRDANKGKGALAAAGAPEPRASTCPVDAAWVVLDSLAAPTPVPDDRPCEKGPGGGGADGGWS